jgi:hypothetical protein
VYSLAIKHTLLRNIANRIGNILNKIHFLIYTFNKSIVLFYTHIYNDKKIYSQVNDFLIISMYHIYRIATLNFVLIIFVHIKIKIFLTYYL